MANFSILDACTLFGPWPQHAADLSVETLLSGMKNNGIVRSLATSTIGIFHDYRQGNVETIEVARQYPQQLFPVATLDPRAFPECLGEAEQRAGEGFRLFRFFPQRQGWPLHFAPFREALKTCEQLNVPIAVTTAHAGEMTDLSEMVKSLQTPILLAGVDSSLLGEAIAVMRDNPKIYLETAGLLAPGALEAVREGVPGGIERLVFASYSPLRYLSSAIGPILASALSDDEKALVLGGNLKQLLTK
ncbi:MAG TPA: amidohydrolase family protein [Abditibacteriaceae bacterium]|jgi:predicted TIM-barrel fold metal-dependent hydrolase|nr:amidohydrolase family protein [Abditibacteriaceae bacterium]